MAWMLYEMAWGLRLANQGILVTPEFARKLFWARRIAMGFIMVNFAVFMALLILYYTCEIFSFKTGQFILVVYEALILLLMVSVNLYLFA